MFDDVKARLESFGYTVTDNDTALINFCIEKVQHHINNQCNTDIVPDGIYKIAVDMVCGEFLFVKKSTGQLTLSSINLDTAVKSIQEGDTNITFAIGEGSSTPEQRLDSFINSLRNPTADFIAYRSIRW
ncbi:MAG: hypothetical protein N2171_04860 [Clostridia bacterium]|nr:hypothetical protein [Clostridia bacterium]